MTTGAGGAGGGSGCAGIWTGEVDWRTCVGKAGQPDPAEMLLEGAVRKVLVKKRMENTIYAGKEELTAAVGQELGIEVAEEAVENAIGAWMERGHLFKWASVQGALYGWSTTGGATMGNETELIRYRKVREDILYQQRTVYKENIKDGSGNWKEWVKWVDGKLPGVVLGRFLHVVARDKLRQEWAANYVTHLIGEGKKEEQLESVLKTLKSNFKNHDHFAEVKCWYGVNMEELQSAAGRKNKEIRVIQRKLREGEIYDVSFMFESSEFEPSKLRKCDRYGSVMYSSRLFKS